MISLLGLRAVSEAPVALPTSLFDSRHHIRLWPRPVGPIVRLGRSLVCPCRTRSLTRRRPRRGRMWGVCHLVARFALLSGLVASGYRAWPF